MPNPNGEKPHDDFVAGLDDTIGIAETYLLACCIRQPEHLAELVETLAERDFPTIKWRHCYAGLLELHTRGEIVEPATLAQCLHKRGSLPNCTYADILGLWELNPTGQTLGVHIGVLRDQSLLRQLEDAGNSIAGSAATPRGSVEEVLGKAEAQVRGLAELTVPDSLVPIGTALAEVYDKLDRARTVKPGLKTPWDEANRLTGGLQPGELIVVGSRPSVGKTALACNLAVEVAVRQGKGVLFASLEQSRVELVERMLCSMSHVDGQKVRLGLLGKFETRQLADSGDLLNKAPLWIDDRAGQRVLRIAASARRLKDKIGLVLVDYLQLCESDDRREARHEQVSAICKQLKGLAKDLKIPVVALAQLNRAVEDGGAKRRPRLSDLRESGGIEANADTVWLLHRGEERGKSPTPIEVLIEKQRNGPSGAFVLNFFPQWLLFQSLSELEVVRHTHYTERED